MKYITLIIGLLSISMPGLAQSAEELSAVKAPIEKLFDGMRAGDSSMVRAAFLPEAQLQTITKDETGETVIRAQPIDGFLQVIGTPREEVLDERIWSYDIRVDGPLATVWTPYSFFLGENFSHCGVNAFQLVNTTKGWKISQIIDTRRREGCRQEGDEDETAIHQLLDNWHQAAADADADTFFGSMTEDGIYLGTDASERWLRDELRSWAKKAFERETAWAFTPSDRTVYFGPANQIAWFEESLDTWMGPCRGSGVLTKTADGWKIKHYNLTVTVPNDKMDAFKKLMKK